MHYAYVNKSPRLRERELSRNYKFHLQVQRFLFALCRELPGEKKQTLFEVEDEKALDEAKAVVAIARNARQFTDVNNFSLRCLTCQTPLKGQEDARSHAGKTGHTNFGEV